MKIEVLHALKDNFIYLLEVAGRCAVVDPGEAEPVRRALGGRSLEIILCTHHHADHVGGVEALQRESGAEVICSAHDRPRIGGATRAVHDGELLPILDLPMRVIEVPGHTLGHVAYFFAGEGALFTGDTLFSAGCGRLFEGTAEQMFTSLNKLKALPAATKIYFGHEYTVNNLNFVRAHEPRADIERHLANARRATDTTPSTLAIELEINPFLRARDVADFGAWRSLRDAW